MKETEFLGKLMPGHPDVLPIIESIREKYSIPPVDPEDDIDEILLTRDDIDWDAVKQDIDAQVKDFPFFDEKETAYLQGLRTITNLPFDAPEFAALSNETREGLKKVFSILIQPYALSLTVIEEKTYKPLSDMIFEYLLTGKTRDVPEEWFGKVFTGDILGDKIVIAMAGEGTNPKLIAEQFKSEITKTFGKYKFDVTETHVATAEYYAMKKQGNSIRRLVERYEEKHPSEFPTDKNSKAYKQTKAKHREMMKKRVQKLEDFLHKL